MIEFSGYLLQPKNEDFVELPDRSLTVSSCGHYRFVKMERFETSRPQGRPDWQLLYVSKGRGYFVKDGQTYVAEPGQCALYRPGEPQNYYYLLEDNPEIFWIHFAGPAAGPMLEELEMKDFIFPVGIQSRYAELFTSIIRELQVKPQGYLRMTEGLTQELVTLMSRMRDAPNHVPDSPIYSAIEEMNLRYREDITVEEYAKKYAMSVCWFIRSFKARTGSSPQQYVISVRISKACQLLVDTSFNISEISVLVGYDNPLYFSRLFKQGTGLSPSDYRKQKQGRGGV